MDQTLTAAQDTEAGNRDQRLAEAAAAPGDPVAPEKCGEIMEQLGRIEQAVQTYIAVAEIHAGTRGG